MREDLSMREEVFDRCRAALPGWRDLSIDEVEFDAPKGFSSFTMGVRPKRHVDPPAVLYRHLAGKQNAILDADTERRTFLLLDEHGIAAHCHHYDRECRIEEFYRGRTLTRHEVFVPSVRRGVAAELARLHRLEPRGLPTATFFELVHEQWSPMARSVLVDRRTELPPDEQVLCDDLLGLTDDATHEQVMRCLPDRAPVFCHNDTYHGNVMLLDGGRVKLLDFEFSCRNHVAFDIANLFAETTMRHGLPEPPHVDLAEPEFTTVDLAAFVDDYLDHAGARSSDGASVDGGDRAAERERLVSETERALVLPDYMYAMAAVTLALQPVQQLRFIPYAHRRFRRFRDAWDAERAGRRPSPGLANLRGS